MNKQQSPLDSLVVALKPVVNKLLANQNQGNKKNRRPRRRQKRQKDPLALQMPRNQGLNLTSSQFTATSPLNLFTIQQGSTPGGVRVRGRELVQAVTLGTTSGGFIIATGFGGDLNGVGNPSSFPRLSAYNNLYEYFIFHRVTYIFQSNQPTTATGEIILAVDYDPTDAPPTSTAGMMRNVSSTMANIYSDCSLQVLKSLSRLPRYETSNVTEPLQQQQYELYVAAEGVTAASGTTVGYIIAEYDVEFFTPQ